LSAHGPLGQPDNGLHDGDPQRVTSVLRKVPEMEVDMEAEEAPKPNDWRQLWPIITAVATVIRTALEAWRFFEV
jgi:hypothetical protein